MRKRYILLLTISIFCFSWNGQAQIQTTYFMKGYHQAGYLNPAYQNECNGYMALPVLSGMQYSFAHTGFDYNDLIRPGTGVMKDSLILDINNMKSKLGKSNYLLFNLNLPIMGFGFWVRDLYFTFDITNKTHLRFGYPGDLVKLVDGNGAYLGENNPLEIKDFGPDFYNYTEFAIGVAKKLTHRLTVGGKLKILTGTACLESKSSELLWYTSEAPNYYWRFESDIEYNISGPLTIEENEDGFVDIEEKEDMGASDFISGKNLGLGLDLGGTYQLNDKIKLFASITDLGFIGWKTNTSNLKQSGTFEFTGLTIDSIWSGNTEFSEGEELADSISDFFKFRASENTFTTYLPTNIFLGGTYEVVKGIDIGLLSRTYFYDRKAHQAFTLSSNFRPTKWFTASLSYSILNRSYTNIGLGMGLKAGPVQFYFVSDNISTALWPKNSKSFSFQSGINFYFGCGKRQNYSMINNDKPDKEVDFM